MGKADILNELKKFKTGGKYQAYVYEASKTKSKDPFLPKFKKIEYSRGKYRFIDRYTGGEKFAGEEVVYYKKQPIWLANYYGKIMVKNIKMDEIYGFLGRALAAGYGKTFFRGLNGFKEDDYKYKNDIKGNLNFAKGTEEIIFKGKKVYILYYHSGILEDSRQKWDWNV